jgi:hypothetical protein
MKHFGLAIRFHEVANEKPDAREDGNDSMTNILFSIVRLAIANCLRVAGIAFLLSCSFAVMGMGSKEANGPHVTELPIRGGPIGWHDNESIVVHAHLGDKQTRSDGVVEEVGRIATYNYKTGEQRVFGKATSGQCYSDGYISYIFLDKMTDELWASYGPLGNEVTRKIKRGEMSFDRGTQYQTCRPSSERLPPPEWARGKYYVWNLRADHGVLSCATLDYYEQTVKARFHRRDDSIGVELPFTCYDVRRGFMYYPFKNAYFAQEFAPVIPWPQGRDRKAYWLYPDGRVETIVFPYSTAIRGEMLPTAKGILALSVPESRAEDYRIHFIAPEGTKELYRGYGFGVGSPDGCKVAMILDEDYTARVRTSGVKTPVKFIVVDFCRTNR